MSHRQLLNRTTAALIVLTIAALVAVAVTWPRGGNTEAAALAVRQQALVADLDRHLADSVAAEDFATVNASRAALGRTVVLFNSGLEALNRGGTVEGPDGAPLKIRPVRGDEARRALSGASALWLQVGLPLSDLAAGEYSVFSAAGQQAIDDLHANASELTSHLAAVAAACDRPASTGRMAQAARLLALASALALIGTLIVQRRLARPANDAPNDAPASRGLAPAGAVSRYSAEPASASVERPRPVLPNLPYKSPVDFEDVSAAVDQVAVDMGTIAASTDKMKAAIDSVGVALQGMIYRLNDLGDDTAEGYRMVRGANNAASYTTQVATELAESVREMGLVIGRVGQLAQRCRQTAAAIDQEAEQTGRTGASFTEAVSGQVKALAAQTANATAEIEHTVSVMLSSTREYEESVGQILKHISAIHKVSQSLGQLVLDPPASVVVGAPRPRTRVLEPAAPVQAAAAVDPDALPEPTPAQVVEQTAAAIASVAAPAPAAPGAAAPPPVADTPPAPVAAAPAPQPAPAPVTRPVFDQAEDAMPAYVKPKVTFSLDDGGADTPPPPAIPTGQGQAPGKTSVFMLHRPQPVAEAAPEAPAPVAASAAPTPAPAPAPAAPVAAAAAPTPAPVAAATGSFEDTIAAATATATVEPEAEAEAEQPAAAPTTNIFMLSDPKQTPKPRMKG
ncbi:MAG TPA: hypothetical protein PLQ13_00045 [Candidatus Krumholzibacteria bacterium]|nr:hypothetical protein [Candidatus Krumholzibacteria bacterium]